jgi:hypothetical protein
MNQIIPCVCIGIIVLFTAPRANGQEDNENRFTDIDGLPDLDLVVSNGLSSPRGSVIETIKIDGGKVEITSRKIKVEGGKVEIIRQVTAAREFPAVHDVGKLLPETSGSGCAFLDYNNDGRPDLLFFSPRIGPDVKAGMALTLYSNDGNGRFTDVSRDVGLFFRPLSLDAALSVPKWDAEETETIRIEGGKVEIIRRQP